MNSVAALQLFLFQVENKNVATRGRQENSYASILTPAENKQTNKSEKCFQNFPLFANFFQ